MASSSSSTTGEEIAYAAYQVTGGFAVEPIKNCPHVISQEHFCMPTEMKDLLVLCSGVTSEECSKASCSETDENWMCLTCGSTFCSRYKNGHMAEHCSQEDEDNPHCLAISFSDLSVWCYKCDSYIENDSVLRDVHSLVYRDKFGELPEVTRLTEEDIEKAAVETEEENIDNEQNYKSRVKQIAKLIKEGSAKKIIVLTGAGISVAAGIPDFRTPGTGLYDNLHKYNLPYPTAIFELDYFKKNPKPFFELTKDFVSSGYKPTLSHYFIKLLHDKGLLLRNYTQNIDGLELMTGIDKDVTIQAHGCYDTSHCIRCDMEYDLAHVKSIIATDGDDINVPYCEKCGGVIKPDIVLFGESLPDRFVRNVRPDLRKADLLIVMGTSLSVYPVANIPTYIDESRPRVLFNRERVGPFEQVPHRPIDYFVGAPLDIDDATKMLAEELGWLDELNEAIAQGPVDLAASK